MTTLIPIHSAAMCQVDQVRCAIVVGAKSLFHSGECDTSSCSSTKSRRSAGSRSGASVVMKCSLPTNLTNLHESEESQSEFHSCRFVRFVGHLCSVMRLRTGRA